MRQLKTLLQDGNQDVGADGDPDLRLHGILAGAEKRLDPQMLLDPFEEQLDLPSLPVQLRDQFRRQCKVVGQKRYSFAVLVPDHDPPQRSRIVLARIKDGQGANLVAEHVGALAIHRLRIAALELGIFLGAGDEECLRLTDKHKSMVVASKA